MNQDAYAKPIVIDTCLYLKGAALQIGEKGLTEATASRFDRNHATRGLTPRQARALFVYHNDKKRGIIVPKLQQQEVQGVIWAARERRELGPHNQMVTQCLEGFVTNMVVGNKTPILLRAFEQQEAVFNECIRQANALKGSWNEREAAIAARFIEKNEHYQYTIGAKRNFDRALSGQKPEIWMDWYLCYAAKRFNTKVATCDTDFVILNEAFSELLNYTPAEFLVGYPDTCDLDKYVAKLKEINIPDPGPPQP